MDLELLKRFYIVAQEGTVWRAADRIHVAQSAVTRSINLFEHQMNFRMGDPQIIRLFVGLLLLGNTGSTTIVTLFTSTAYRR